MTPRVILAVGLCALGLGASGASAKTDDPVIAQVGAQTLTASGFARAIAALDPELRRKAAGDRQALLELVRSELGREAILAQARARHWDKRPDVAARAEHAHDDVVITSFLAAEVAPPAGFPSDDAIRQVYQANLSRFMKPREYHVAQIYIARPADNKPQEIALARAHAGTLAEAARAPDADFAALARKSSEDHDSAPRGGDLGWVPEKLLLPEIARTVAGLADNEISDPIEVADGWHILRELGTRPPAPESLEQVRPTIVALLRDQESTRLGQAYVGELLARGHAEVDLDAVHALLAKQR